MWAIQAIVRDFTDRDNARWGCVTREIPTFYLNENVQGITDEAHAKEITREILNPSRNPMIQVVVTAVNVGSMRTQEHVKPAPEEYLFLVKFKPFYAKYWTPDNADKTFRAIKYSLSDNSLWVWIDDQEKCVPVNILMVQCVHCKDWVNLVSQINARHYCPAITLKKQTLM